MTRKLTDVERETIDALMPVLVSVLPADERSHASGIASALVRIPGPYISDNDLDARLDKYAGEDPDVKEQLVKAVKQVALDEVEGQTGVYTLRVPEGVAPDQDASQPADDKGRRSGKADKHVGKAKAKRADKEQAEGEQEEKPKAKGKDSKDNKKKNKAAQPQEHPAAEASDNGSSSKPGAPDKADEPQKHDGSDKPGKPSRRSAKKVASGKAHKETPAAQDDAADGSEPAPAASSRHDEDASEAGQPSSSEQAQPVPPDAAAADAAPETDADAVGQDAADDAVALAAEAEDAAVEADAPDVEHESGSEHKQTHVPSKKPRSKASSSSAEGKQQAQSTQPATQKHRPDEHKRDLRHVPYVRRGGENEAQVRQKIVALDPRFWTNGWLLSHPGAYTLYEPELQAINKALVNGALPGDITHRQLAYQIGGDEKFFEYGSDGFRLLRAMGMEDVVRHRPIPKPDLVYHAPRRRKHMRVLVTENLDPYLDVHDLMYEEGRSMILGERIHAVVLGSGTPVLERNRLSLLLDTLRADSVEVLYWGDIDRAGLDIMMRLKDVLGDKYDFKPFAPAYQLMVQRAMERFPDPADNEQTGQVNIEQVDTSLLDACLSPKEADYMHVVIDQSGLIPQEILTKHDL